MPEGDTIHRVAAPVRGGARRQGDRARRRAQRSLAAASSRRRARRADARVGRGVRQAPAPELLRRPGRPQPPRHERPLVRPRRRPAELRQAVAASSPPGRAIASQSGGKILRMTSAARARNDPVLLQLGPDPLRPGYDRGGGRRAAARLRAGGPGRRGVARPDADRRDRQRDPDRGVLPPRGQPLAAGRRAEAETRPRRSSTAQQLGDGDRRSRPDAGRSRSTAAPARPARAAAAGS